MPIIAIVILLANGVEAAEQHVTVCVKPPGATTTAAAESQAMQMATKMFLTIGVDLEWRWGGQSTCGPDAILMSFSTSPSESRPRQVLATSRPFEGRHIEIFLDRVRTVVTPNRMPCLLAHVMVHEITHILQGIKRHSTSGLMKG